MGKTKESRGKNILMKILSKPSSSQGDMQAEDISAESMPARDSSAEDSPVEDSHTGVSRIEDTPAENMSTEAVSTADLTPRPRDPRSGGLGRSSIDSIRGRRRRRLQGCVLPVRLPRDFTIGHFLVGVGIAAAGIGVIFLDAGQDCAQAQAHADNSKEEEEEEAPGVPLIVITPPAEAMRSFEWWFGPSDVAFRMSARE
ncbi:hypothetical protein B0J13DRAFT_5962 [Dactylonectria estremocensis]|uniref:Uncharacterized protein n=1 Tax=Dactylonectria estremocensis TaxID=1079267 RepID=A0A9P9FIW6_9HYPO|nr:hypothetical protein B0J13DRAFT_5962 [Dactylonectria estremocensis]